MEKLKIIVACHKPCELPKDNFYLPIHCGKAISDINLGIQGDDTGENISAKNPHYSELTAEYWGWKNLNNVEYIGLCHYRRFFITPISESTIDSVLGERYDIMLVKPRVFKTSAGYNLLHATCVEDIKILLCCLKEEDEKIYSFAKTFLKNNKWIPYNMFIMKKTLFDKYAEWQFKILFKAEKYIQLSSYTRGKRVFGYLSEVLLPIWCLYNKFKITYSETGPSTKIPKNTRYLIHKALSNIRRLINNICFCFIRENLYWLDYPSVTIGLQIDGILDGNEQLNQNYKTTQK